MSKVYNFKNYVKEEYAKKPNTHITEGLLGKITDWARSIVSIIKSSKIKRINKGPYAGLPIINYFSPGGGKSILQQIQEVYGKSATTQELSMANESTNMKDQKPLAHLKSPWPSVPDLSAAEIINDLVDDYHILVETGWQKPMFIYGAPGIGKTEIVAQVCDRLGIALMPIELRYCQPVDLIGVPKVIEDESPEAKRTGHGAGITRANPPAFWPRSNKGPNDPAEMPEEEGKGGIIFFDEFNRADSYLMDALLQFIQMRALLGTSYKLPSKWMIVAAGNRPQDDRPDKIRDLGTALIDRFTLVNYVPSPQDFITHVGNYQKEIIYKKKLGQIVLPEIISFVSHLPEWFHGKYNEDDSDMGNFTPRGWIDASKKLESVLQQRMKPKTDGAGNIIQKGARQISMEELTKIFTKEVGFKAAKAFLTFYDLVKKTPIEDIDKVFNDPSKAPLPKKVNGSYQPDLMWAWMAALVSYVEKQEKNLTPDQWKNAIEYWVRIDNAEYSGAFINMMQTHNEYLKQSRTYFDNVKIWQKHYSKMLQ